jgi:hypothetical protein
VELTTQALLSWLNVILIVAATCAPSSGKSMRLLQYKTRESWQYKFDRQKYLGEYTSSLEEV